jgi:hypothetical protein
MTTAQAWRRALAMLRAHRGEQAYLLPDALAEHDEHDDDGERDHERLDVPGGHLPPQGESGVPLVADVEHRLLGRCRERAVER